MIFKGQAMALLLLKSVRKSDFSRTFIPAIAAFSIRTLSGYRQLRMKTWPQGVIPGCLAIALAPTQIVSSTCSLIKDYTLFGNEVAYAQLASALAKQGDIRTTTLMENFGFKDFLEKHLRRALPLFAIGPDTKMHVFTASRPIMPEPEWSIIYLLIQRKKTQE